MKKIIIFIMIITFTVSLVACSAKEKPADYSGIYEGFSWKGENTGVLFDDATEYIKTTLNVAKDGTILDASLDFKMLKDGVWKSRLVRESSAEIDYTVNPASAVPGTNYVNGTSMFTVNTGEWMSFYAIGVSDDHIAALLMVDPITRYQFEIKLPNDFDYTQKVSSLTIGSGLLVPTRRAAGGALVTPTDWETFANKHFFNISYWSHVLTDTGVLKDFVATSTVQEMLERFGVSFINGKPSAMETKTGYTGLGGWSGNYNAIKEFLVGKNILEVTSLVDWSLDKYKGSINSNNQFGVDTIAGVTKIAQNSIDTIAGATVRLSRESEAYQKALVDAGVLTLDDVIIGRF